VGVKHHIGMIKEILICNNSLEKNKHFFL